MTDIAEPVRDAALQGRSVAGREQDYFLFVRPRGGRYWTVSGAVPDSAAAPAAPADTAAAQATPVAPAEDGPA